MDLNECFIWRAMGIDHRYKLVEVEFYRDGCTLVLADGYIFIESECNRRFFEYVDWDTEKDLLKAVKAEAETICEEALSQGQTLLMACMDTSEWFQKRLWTII